MPEFLQTSITKRIANVTLRRPELRNAFNETLIAEITAAFTELGADDEVRVIVLSGEGSAFCAGADVHWMKRVVDYSIEENIEDAATLADMLAAIRDCPKPVIARIHGPAIGGGVGLVAACDIAIAVHDAIFCLSEVKLGILPAVISPFVINKIGPSTMRRYALTAERFDGLEAKRIGLVNEAVETVEDMDAGIKNLCKLLKQTGPKAVAECKKLLHDVRCAGWDEARTITTKSIARARVSDEGQEGLKAFLEKRPPNWIK